ncbi:MAG: hypothetical protein SGARI_000548 [Bacillariaceae sp.]
MRIIGNETLEDDIREVMLESLLNPIHGMPDRAQRNPDGCGNQGAVFDNDQPARPLEHQDIPDESRNEALAIQAEEILANEDIDEALRQALLESIVEAAQDENTQAEAGPEPPVDGEAGHHQNQDEIAEWYALRAEEIFANEGMEEDIRQALLESMYDPPEGLAAHDEAVTDVADAAEAQEAAQIYPNDHTDEGLQQALMNSIRVPRPPEPAPMQDEMAAIFEANINEIVNDEALHPDVRQAILNSVFEATV